MFLEYGAFSKESKQTMGLDPQNQHLAPGKTAPFGVEAGLVPSNAKSPLVFMINAGVKCSPLPAKYVNEL